MDTVKVLVVDDHALFRRGIATVLANQENLEIVGEAVDGLEAIKKAEEQAETLAVREPTVE